MPRHPGPEDCFPCLRIGQLLTSGPRDALDKWWQANDVAQIHDSATALEMTGLPFLAGFKNRRDVALWTRMDVQGAPGMLLLAAATCALAGESQKSNFILAKLETSPVPAWRPRIQNVRGLISP